jgi:hypothetical protein
LSSGRVLTAFAATAAASPAAPATTTTLIAGVALGARVSIPTARGLIATRLVIARLVVT